MMKRFGLAVTHCQKDAHDEQLLDPPPLLLPMHKRLAMGEAVETGAGKGALGGKSSPKTPA